MKILLVFLIRNNMIKTRNDLREYIKTDREVQPPHHNLILTLLFDRTYRLKTLLRKCEYHYNNLNTHGIMKLWHVCCYAIDYARYHHVSKTLGTHIGFNIFGKGLIIWHPEGIITNDKAKVGDYCSISARVVIGSGNEGKCPIIGNNVELMINATCIGGIQIADHVRIGANSLVIKDILEPDTTYGGLPAHKISDRGTIECPVPRA